MTTYIFTLALVGISALCFVSAFFGAKLGAAYGAVGILRELFTHAECIELPGDDVPDDDP